MKNKDQKLLNSFGNIKTENFHFELIKSYFRKNKSTDFFQKLSDKTCNDLDLEDLFIFLDRTHSRVGQQFLYNQLRTIPNKLFIDINRENIIAEISTNNKFKLLILKKLNKLKSQEAYHISTLFQEKHTKAPQWFSLIPFLSFASLLCFVFAIFNSYMLLVNLVIFIINLLIHYWNKKNLFQYIGSIPQLLRLNKVATELFQNKSLQQLDPDLHKDILIINQIKRRMAIFQMEAKIQSEMEAVIWTAFEILKIAFLLEPLFLFGALKRLETKRNELENIFRFVGEVDVLQSIAGLRSKLDTYCVPTIKDELTLQFQDINHPLIENCVTNNFCFHNNSTLLTGSNMSGKTSFIRAIGLNILTGLTINTCFAKSAVLSKVQLHSAIRISDDLLNDKSYYFEEVLTINEMLKQVKGDKPNIFLLDEIFKGTNTIERISAAKAVLSFLAKDNNLVFVATHDIELTELLKQQYDLYHFSEMVNNNNVDFDYKLKKGPLKHRNAIKILQLNNYPKKIIDEAMKLSEQLSSAKHFQ